MRPIQFELCAETVAACIAAGHGGAARIEICSSLAEDGLTPSHGLVREALAHTKLPVHVLLRPHTHGFHYSSEDLDVMRADLQHARELGASGVVLGILHNDHRVDIEATRQFVRLAAPMEVTFHRAIDQAPLLPQALEDVIAAGCHRVLTSGGRPNVQLGAGNIGRLVEQASGRIVVAAGGGLTQENAAEVGAKSATLHFHGSLRRATSGRQAADSLTANLRQVISTLAGANVQ